MSTRTRFTRRFDSLDSLNKALKGAKALDVAVDGMSAMGTWRSLHPVGNDYLDYEGPFAVTRGTGPAFLRNDGTEVFMLNDTSAVVVTFTVEDE